ncbi:hypothetical protein Tco_0603185 [Tanacetum coccineum]
METSHLFLLLKLVMRHGLKTPDKMRQWDVRGMDHIPPVLQDILLYLLPMGNKRTAKSVFAHFFSVQEYYYGEATARAMEDA